MAKSGREITDKALTACSAEVPKIRPGFLSEERHTKYPGAGTEGTPYS